MRDVEYVSALLFRALGQHVRAVLVSAVLQRPQGAAMARQNGVLIGSQVPIFESADDLREQDHGTAPQLISKLSARVFTAWRALLVVVVVR
jgi:hypothetical protein